MKKFLTHAFVVLVNFYLLSFFLGLLLAFWTLLYGPVGTPVWLGMVFLSFLTVLLYQLNRKKLKIRSLGEIIISNRDKDNILHQENLFTITRLPLFLLILVTLVINGNLLDGLSEGKRYNLISTVSLTAVFFATYFGLKAFFTYPRISAAYVIVFSLFFVGSSYKFSANAAFTEDLLFKVYAALAVCWAIAGIVYKYKTNKNVL